MIRPFRLFARLQSERGVPVIVDRHVEPGNDLGELRVRYGDKVQLGRCIYSYDIRQVRKAVSAFLHDQDLRGRPFRHSHKGDQ